LFEVTPVACHGTMLISGPFASTALGNSGLATMKIIDDSKKT